MSSLQRLVISDLNINIKPEIIKIRQTGDFISVHSRVLYSF